MKILLAVPMRSISNRLARKLFKAETGKPLALHTLEAAIAAAKVFFGETQAFGIADAKLYDFLKRYAPANNFSQHNGDFENGTQRIFSWLKRCKWEKHFDCVVNWQADEPMLDAADVMLAVEHAIKTGRITTLGLEGLLAADAVDPNIVKAFAKGNECKDFTRWQEPPIHPLRRLDHIGLYAFPRCYYEIAAADATAEAKRRGLEQITWLENGATVDILDAEHTRKFYGGHYKIDSVIEYRRFVAKYKAMH